MWYTMECGVLFILKEELNYIICRYIHGIGGHHIKYSKPGLER
jgi:hypothetical protein